MPPLSYLLKRIAHLMLRVNTGIQKLVLAMLGIKNKNQSALSGKLQQLTHCQTKIKFLTVMLQKPLTVKPIH